VAEIAARLDGLPLAIELAATRVKVLSPQEMLPRLRMSLSMLTSTVRTLPERQRTLRGAIAWSHDLLDDAERRLFARLSVFAGGWALESAEAVCDPEGLRLDPLDGVASLADQSLIRRMESPEGSVRFSMLEAIREYGQDRLRVTGELEATRRRHAEHFLDLALEAEPHLTADDQREWLDRCDREHANIRAALRWAIEVGEAGRAQEAAGALWRFWQQRGHLAEGRRWFEEILALPEGRGRTRARAKALAGAGGIAWWQADIPVAIGFYEEALAIEREVDDPAGIAEAMYNRAFGFAAQGDAEASTQLLEESLALFRSVGNESGIARALSGLALTDALANNWRSVIVRQEEAAAFWRRVGDRFQIADGLSRLGVAYARVGDGTAARSALLEALDLFQEVGNLTGLTQIILDLSFLASWEGRPTDAIRLAGAWESVRQAAEGGPPADFLGELVGDPHGEARAQLSEASAERAWKEGRLMNVDQALALARAEAGRV
jgi:tetratricopeptide (TPR) repeat protein